MKINSIKQINSIRAQIISKDQITSIRGQTTIELLILLSISMVALLIIFSLYINYLNYSFDDQDYFLAKSSVDKIVSAANLIYFSGPGSEVKIEVEFPKNINFSESGFFDSYVIIVLKNGNSFVGKTDVNIIGEFRPMSGKNILYLEYDGNTVNVKDNLFELNKKNISIFGVQGETLTSSFSIRNNSGDQINFYLDNNFSHNFVSLELNDEQLLFTLDPAEVKQIDLNFVLSEYSQGNYSGFVLIKGELADVNYYERVFVSTEVLPKSNELFIYPKVTNFSNTAGESEVKSFNLCNSSNSEITIISWNKNGSASDWFSEPIINSVQSNTCEDFSITFTIPLETSIGFYDANIVANYDSNIVYAGVFIEVLEEE